MEDETSSSEPLLARVEAQCGTPNGNGFHAIDEHNDVEVITHPFVYTVNVKLLLILEAPLV